MRRIGPDLPRLWWLNPWPLVRDLHQTACALKVLTDMDDRLIQQQDARIKELEDGLDRLHAAIISGRAVVPDAEPVAEEGGQPNRQYHQALSANRKLLEENARLKAEVERLTKAGDAMIDEWWLQLSCPNRMKASWLKEKAIADWNAAKQGGQP